MQNKSNKETTIVIGLGKTGFSCVEFLTQAGCQVLVMDTRNQPPGLDEMRAHFPEVEVITGGLDENRLCQAAEIIVSPGVSIKEPAIAAALAKGVHVSSDIELFVRQASAPIVAITGTNGKSTVTTLLGEMAKSAGLNVKIGGNLGVPALTLLSDQAELYVLELSSYHLETTHSLAAKVAVNLNVSPDHLDRYDSFDDYAATKLKVYQNCRRAVINRDDPMSFQKSELPNSVLSFGLANEPGQFSLVEQQGKWFIAKGNTLLISSDEILLKGKHQIKNCMAALALAEILGLSEENSLAVLRKFKGLKHRCQLIREKEGVRWYDDSKGTNVGAVQAAVQGLGSIIEGKVVLIAGGRGKDTDYADLIAVVKQYVKQLILIGEDAKLMHSVLNPVVECDFANDLADAVIKANHKAQAGDIVLLSPACASYDMFKNFEQRGEVFIEAVNSL